MDKVITLLIPSDMELGEAISLAYSDTPMDLIVHETTEQVMNRLFKLGTRSLMEKQIPPKD